ncbi:MAG: hypothetical protein V1704_04890 [Candidatus Vogelbacteria bacterium]
MIKIKHKASVPALLELVNQITKKNRPPLVEWGKSCGREVW